MPWLVHISSLFELLTFTYFHIKQLFWEDERGKGHRPCLSVKNPKPGDKDNFGKIDKQNKKWNKTSKLPPGGSAKREHDNAPDRFREERPSQQIGGEEEGWWESPIIPVVAIIFGGKGP